VLLKLTVRNGGPTKANLLFPLGKNFAQPTPGKAKVLAIPSFALPVFSQANGS
jgi:hypothetical protein